MSKKILIHSLIFSPDGVSTAYLEAKRIMRHFYLSVLQNNLFFFNQ